MSPSRPVDRRSVTCAALWTAPAVALATTTPAFATSGSTVSPAVLDGVGHAGPLTMSGSAGTSSGAFDLTSFGTPRLTRLRCEVWLWSDILIPTSCRIDVGGSTRAPTGTPVETTWDAVPAPVGHGTRQGRVFTLTLAGPYLTAPGQRLEATTSTDVEFDPYDWPRADDLRWALRLTGVDEDDRETVPLHLHF